MALPVWAGQGSRNLRLRPRHVDRLAERVNPESLTTLAGAQGVELRSPHHLSIESVEIEHEL